MVQAQRKEAANIYDTAAFTDSVNTITSNEPANEPTHVTADQNKVKKEKMRK